MRYHEHQNVLTLAEHHCAHTHNMDFDLGHKWCWAAVCLILWAVPRYAWEAGHVRVHQEHVASFDDHAKALATEQNHKRPHLLKQIVFTFFWRLASSCSQRRDCRHGSRLSWSIVDNDDHLQFLLLTMMHLFTSLSFFFILKHRVSFTSSSSRPIRSSCSSPSDSSAWESK